LALACTGEDARAYISWARFIFALPAAAQQVYFFVNGTPPPPDLLESWD